MAWIRLINWAQWACFSIESNIAGNTIAGLVPNVDAQSARSPMWFDFRLFSVWLQGLRCGLGSDYSVKTVQTVKCSKCKVFDAVWVRMLMPSATFCGGDCRWR